MKICPIFGVDIFDSASFEIMLHERAV